MENLVMKIYNTMTRQKEEFNPVEAGKVKLYACGPTVYNYFHIGNARAFLIFDVVRRYFEFRGYDVTYVQNVTDIDDKIIAQAIEENKDYSQIADKYYKAFMEDARLLGLKQPHHQPKATDVMDEIIHLIAQLVEKGHAYEVDGDVYFWQESLPQYGQLSGKKIEEQKVGARIEENTAKRHPADFTLWKRSKPGEPSWESPWGLGRPGWHSECVVMSQKYLGETFDIHGGGIDLVFPHHENELAQAWAITGKPLANYWMHNGFLNIEGEKMSKSLNNFFTAREIMAQFEPEVIRFYFLSKHYRSPIDFNRELVEESQRALGNFYSALKSIDYLNINREFSTVTDLEPESRFIEAMEDDFNTAKAISILFELAGVIRDSSLELSKRQDAALLLVRLGDSLGFFQDLDQKLKSNLDKLAGDLIDLIIKYRLNARTAKNWALSDQIRDDLHTLGIEVKDTKDGSTWTIKD